MAFAPDGRTLATASDDKTVLLWDVTDPARPRRLGDPLTGHTDAVNGGGVRPGRAHPGHRQRRPDGAAVGRHRPGPAAPPGRPADRPHRAVNAVAFAPDGHTLATASDDNTVLLWDLSGLNALQADPVERACSLTGRGLNCRRVGPLRPRPGLRGLLLKVRPTAAPRPLPSSVSDFR